VQKFITPALYVSPTVLFRSSARQLKVQQKSSDVNAQSSTSIVQKTHSVRLVHHQKARILKRFITVMSLIKNAVSSLQSYANLFCFQWYVNTKSWVKLNGSEITFNLCTIQARRQDFATGWGQKSYGGHVH